MSAQNEPRAVVLASAGQVFDQNISRTHTHGAHRGVSMPKVSTAMPVNHAFSLHLIAAYNSRNFDRSILTFFVRIQAVPAVVY